MVDTRKAGYGGLGLSIEGPSKVDISCDDLDNGICQVNYTPQMTGTYVINVKFADQHVPNSPFHVECTSSEEKLTEVVKEQKAAQVATIGSTCDLNLKIPEQWKNVVSSTQVRTSSRSFSRCEEFVSGRRSVSSRQDGQYQVLSTSSFGPDRYSSQEYQSYEHSVKREDADLSHLVAEVEGPSKVKIPAEIVECSGEESTYSVRFVPKEMGVHHVSVKYFDQHVPGSPFLFTVGPLVEGGAHRVTASGPGLQSALVGIPAEFGICTREAGAGGLSLAVEGPSKAEINFDDRKDGNCGVSYVVTEPGDYEVCVKFNDEHIPGSPFPVTATGKGTKIKEQPSDASKVRPFGPGIRRGQLGANQFTVDCTHAGNNMLLVGVHGPEIPIEEVHVKHQGNSKYSVTYVARESGKYVLIVKWGEDHIPGSPFHVTVP